MIALPTTIGYLSYGPTSNWKYGLVAINNITINNTASICNSYKSANGAYGGSNILDRCYLVVSSSVSSITLASGSLGLSKVYGFIGDQEGTISESRVTGSGAVGNFAWIDGGNSGIQAGRFLTTSFQETIPITPYNLYLPNSVFISASIPYTSGLPLPPIAGTNAITQSGDYFTAIASTYSTGRILQISQSCRIYYANNFATSGAGQITIAPGCSLKIYVRGTISFSGTGIVNLNQTPQTFVFYNISNNNWSLSQGSTWYGCIESQNGNVTLGTEVYGYIIGKAITFSGAPNFHMDESVTRSLA